MAMRVEPKLPDIHHQLEAVANDINSKLPAPKIPREQPQFVTVGNQAADGMVQAAESALNEGQNMLEKVKATADRIKGMLAECEQEIRAYIEKTQALGKDILDASTTFLSTEGKSDRSNGQPR